MVYFEGNAHRVWIRGLGGGATGSGAFEGADQATLYYLPGSTGWGPTFDGRPTALWLPRVETGDTRFGVRTNHFGFTITWARDKVVVVEACTDLADPVWSPVSTHTLTGGTATFTDPDWAQNPARFYRVRGE